eukprot:99219-Pleurochrysis_carterae.AAC.1
MASVLLNVAALCAAIALGAMQLRDNSVPPRLLASSLFLLACTVPAGYYQRGACSHRSQGKSRWCGRASSSHHAHKHQTLRAGCSFLLLLASPERSSLP